jgi:hypothetical protein
MRSKADIVPRLSAKRHYEKPGPIGVGLIRADLLNPASVSGSPTEEVEEAAAFLACEAQGLGEPVMTAYEPPER